MAKKSAKIQKALELLTQAETMAEIKEAVMDLSAKDRGKIMQQIAQRMDELIGLD